MAVKSAKRLLCSNVDAYGRSNNDRLLSAMLQLRNTPDPDCKISPAEIVFGRRLRDSFAFLNRLEKFSKSLTQLYGALGLRLGFSKKTPCVHVLPTLQRD